MISSSVTELTTSATDAIIALESFWFAFRLGVSPTVRKRKALLWCLVFGLVGLAASLGASVHGFEWTQGVRSLLWKPLFLSLGIAVALFLLGAILDWRGDDVAARLLPWFVLMGCVFFGITELLKRGFILFVLYEGVFMCCTLAVYVFLAIKHERRPRGAAVVAIAVFLNLVGAAVQTTDISFRVVVPFDSNGIFHMIQAVALALLYVGLRLDLKHNAGRTMCE